MVKRKRPEPSSSNDASGSGSDEEGESGESSSSSSSSKTVTGSKQRRTGETTVKQQTAAAAAAAAAATRKPKPVSGNGDVPPNDTTEAEQKRREVESLLEMLQERERTLEAEQDAARQDALRREVETLREMLTSRGWRAEESVEKHTRQKTDNATQKKEAAKESKSANGVHQKTIREEPPVKKVQAEVEKKKQKELVKKVQKEGNERKEPTQNVQGEQARKAVKEPEKKALDESKKKELEKKEVDEPKQRELERKPRSETKEKDVEKKEQRKGPKKGEREAGQKEVKDEKKVAPKEPSEKKLPKQQGKKVQKEPAKTGEQDVEKERGAEVKALQEPMPSAAPRAQMDQSSCSVLSAPSGEASQGKSAAVSIGGQEGDGKASQKRQRDDTVPELPNTGGDAVQAVPAAQSRGDQESAAQEADLPELPLTLPPEGDKDAPCELPLWCVTPRPTDIKVEVKIQRLVPGIEKQPAPMLFGKRAWALLGRRIKDSPPGSGPEPDIGLAATRASRQHALLLRNWLGQVYVIDLNSSHGSFIDKVRLAPKVPIEWQVGSVLHCADPRAEGFQLLALHPPVVPQGSTARATPANPVKPPLEKLLKPLKPTVVMNGSAPSGTGIGARAVAAPPPKAGSVTSSVAKGISAIVATTASPAKEEPLYPGEWAVAADGLSELYSWKREDD